jgi:signal transduction histidine kinase
VTTAAARWVAGSVLLLTVAALVAAAAFGVAAHEWRDAFAFAPVLLAFAGVGAFVASHRPRNAIGWLLLAEGLGAALGLAGLTYAKHAVRSGAPPTAASWVAWAAVLFIEAFVPLVLVLLLYPDGRLPSRRWRPAVWLIVGANTLLLAVAATSNVAFEAAAPAGLAAPLALIPDRIASPLVNDLEVMMLLLFLLSAAGCVVRYRRAGGVVRQQIKWFAYAGIVAALGFVLLALMSNDPVIAFIVLVPLIPVAAGIAIMKYRLYDIDVVISKTIVYGSLAAFITLVYVVIVAGIGSLGPGFLQASSRPNLGLSIVATAVVAVAFQPVRERAQRLANRIVFGKRATPYEALSEFAGRMGASYAADDVLPQMAQILAEGTGASRAVVWLKDGDMLVAGATWPAETGPPQRLALAGGEPPVVAGAGRVALVPYQGETLGALSVEKRPGEPLTPVEGRLTSDLAAQAGLVLHNIGLTEQLRARLAELQASRLRIVTAADDQRRRIERDIHDGAQRQLLTIESILALAESVAGQDDERERALVAQLQAETSGALETLRELARGIHPPLLADRGLIAAVTNQAGKAPVPVAVDADGVGRYPAEIESAIYFCCVEALQNATRHAPGSAVRISLAGDQRQVMFAVTDDGPGFDPAAPAAGSGLRNMSDRLAALGGSCQVHSRPGRGTTVTGRIGFGDPPGGSGGRAAGPGPAGTGDAVPLAGRMG